MVEIPKPFALRKKLFMEKLQSAIEAGLVDDDIIDVLEAMNALPFVYTTSSCSGRIFLIDIVRPGRKDLSIKVAKWHHPVSFEEFADAVYSYRAKGTLWLKVEGMIIAYAVPTVEWASFFLKLSRYLGFKDSGVRSVALEMSHIFLDVMSTEKMHVPLARRGRVGLSEDSLRLMYETAVELLRSTKAKLFIWKKAIERLGSITRRQSIATPREISFREFEDLVQLKRRLIERALGGWSEDEHGTSGGA